MQRTDREGDDCKPQECGQQDVVVRLEVCFEGHEALSLGAKGFISYRKPARCSRPHAAKYIFRSQDCLVTTDFGGSAAGGPFSLLQSYVLSAYVGMGKRLIRMTAAVRLKNCFVGLGTVYFCSAIASSPTIVQLSVSLIAAFSNVTCTFQVLNVCIFELAHYAQD